ncbi:MAG TPA: nucleotidyltransferase domain-containing protein, partial [Nitrososphaera sp.]|nr:nucleotidyltransferase domain-containing protein [Nitrososphaera sp.]
MIPETQINEFVERLKTVAGTNLESVLLYGSAASDEFHAEYSDVNVLCIVRELSASALHALAPAVNWWTKSKHPAPLIFTWEELNRSLDVFPIELIDMQRRHRVLHGADVLKTVKVPLDLHRVQLEHDLRTKLLLLRQHYLSADGDNKKVMHLMLGSVSSFITLFR